MKIVPRTARILIIIVLTILFPRCAEEESTVPAGPQWTGKDPISIPFRQRESLYDRGNLVRNPSFELGRVLNVDSSTLSYNVTGWQEMGEHVTWISVGDSMEYSDQVHSGRHAIRIQNSPARGTQGQGEGIVSDFIRVIPGNYTFSFWIKLENIVPMRARRGRRMDGSIDIRIMYFDRNRLLISGASLDRPAEGTQNQSFKSLLFADFWNIDRLGWTEVDGRTTHAYLTEGDIPDEAKYVKLYFGLRARGTMWVDDVDFRYSHKNFTPQERAGSLPDTIPAILDLLIPSPKMAEAAGSIGYHIEGSDSLPMPLVIIPGNAALQTRKAAELLKRRLDEAFERRFGPDSLPGIRIVSDLPVGFPESGALAFRFNPVAEIPGVPANPEQAYTIMPDSLYPNIMSISGGGPLANFYAASTAVQLLDDSLLVFHSARVSDYPDVPERGFLVSPVAAASNTIDYRPYLEDLAALKFNWAYLDYHRSKSLWKQPGTAYLDGLRITGRENAEGKLLSLAQMVNPYAFLISGTEIDSLDKDSRRQWMHSSAASNTALRRVFQAGLNAGVETLVLCTNDYLPVSPEGKFMFYAEPDASHFVNLQEAHIELIRSLKAWKGRGLQLEFLPPWFSNEDLVASRGQAEEYLGDIGKNIPGGVPLVWSGPARKSFKINNVDYARYFELSGRELVMIDNSLNDVPEILEDTTGLMLHPMKLRTLSLFDPFNARYTEGLIESGHISKIIVNSSLSSEIMRIRIATAADYLWNSSDYNPDESIWKVMYSRFGLDGTLELYKFSDAYFTCLASMIALNNGSDKPRLIRTIREQQETMVESLAEMETLLKGELKLLNELKSLKQRTESLFEKEIQSVADHIITAMDTS